MHCIHDTIRTGVIAATAVCALSLAAPAAAQNAGSDFYKGKTVTMYIGLSAGGGYDVYARLVGPYFVKHIPGNPQFVPRNMPGGGGLVMTNYVYGVAPKDGTALGAPQRGVPFEPIFTGSDSNAKFDPRQFNWIGSAAAETSVTIAWHTSGVNSYKDLYERELIVAADGIGTESSVMPYVVANILGFKMKVIAGYPGGSEMNLAVERGEVGGRGTYSWTSFKSQKMDWLRDRKVNILFQMALEKHPDLPDVPLAIDLATTDADREVLKLEFTPLLFGRPYMAPPGVALERVAALRKAFEDTMRDPEFLAEAQKRKLDIDPVSWQRLDALLKEAYAAPKPVLERLIEAGKNQPGLKILETAKKDEKAN